MGYYDLNPHDKEAVKRAFPNYAKDIGKRDHISACQAGSHMAAGLMFLIAMSEGGGMGSGESVLSGKVTDSTFAFLNIMHDVMLEEIKYLCNINLPIDLDYRLQEG